MIKRDMKQFVQMQTSERLKKLESELKNTFDLPEDPDAIHDLRVAIRRLNQTLRVFMAWLDARRVTKLRARLKKLMERCGAVRNCDIAMAVLKAAEWQGGSVLQSLEKERTHTCKRLRKTLQKWHHSHRAERWREKFAVAAGEKGLSGEMAEIARGILPGMTEELFQAGAEAAQAGSTHHQMHRFRLMAKRVRYTLEAFDPVYKTATNEIMESLKGLQEKLGNINDCAATLVMIARNRDASAAVGRLVRERELEFRMYWKRHFGPKVKGQWKAILGEPGPQRPRARRKVSQRKEPDGNLHSAAR
jgi:CHAD domain-containing protein